VLRHEQDAEDACQATFLVLARKAGSIVPPEAVGNWLHGVAYRAARKLRESATRRSVRERLAQPRLTEAPGGEECRADVDDAISRLPDLYRLPVILCELQGLSRKEAAARLGCPEGTLSSRLAKARRLLARHLGGPAAVTAALGVAATASGVPARLVRGVAAVSGEFVSGEVAALAQEVLKAMMLSRVRWVGTLILLTCVFAAGVGGLSGGPRSQPRPPAEAKTTSSEPAKEEQPAELAEAVAVRRFVGHTDGVMVVAFSADGKQALSGGVCYGAGDPTVRLWDVATGKQLLCMEGHTAGVYGVAFLPCRKKAISCSDDHTIRLWDLETGKELKRYEGHQDQVYGIDVTTDGKFLLSGSRDRTVRLWDVESGKEVRRFEGHGSPVRAVALSADGKRAISGGILGEASLRIWDVETGKELAKYDLGGGQEVRFGRRTGAARALSGFDSKYGYGTGFGGLQVAGFSEAGVASVALSPDGKFALAGCMDNKIHVFDLATGQERVLEGHTQQVHGAVFTPDGKRILSAGYDHTVRLWDVATGKELCRFLGHTNWAWGVAVSPDGKLALSGSLDGTVRLWQLPR
jgi:RNA polymerase sigma factor (sigma-70 family)